MPLLTTARFASCGLFVCCALLPLLTAAQEVLVEGKALIVGGDVGQARARAMQRALSMAAVSKAANVSSRIDVQPGSVQESTRVTATACTKDARIVSESVSGEEITVNVSAILTQPGDCPVQCPASYTNKVVVTGFPMEFPHQMEYRETSIIAYATSVELARKLKNLNRLMVDYAEGAFPYSSPARAPEPYLRPQDHETAFSSLAKSHRAQYVISGVYRNLAVQKHLLLASKRTMEIDVYIHDGVNGALLAQRRFLRVATGAVTIGNTPAIGSVQFYQGDFGRAWGALLEDISRWISDTAACLPLVARVLKVDGSQITLDAGVEAGLSAGNTLRLHVLTESNVKGPTGLSLGNEKQASLKVEIKTVYPGFSIADFAGTSFGLTVKSGDLLYLE